MNSTGLNLSVLPMAGFNGVSAGNATATDITLWTRTFDTSDSSGRSGVTQLVTVQIATDPAVATTIYTGNDSTRAENDYTVKFSITGLNPNTSYYYRFSPQSGDVSIAGRFKSFRHPVKPLPFALGTAGMWTA